MKKNVLTRLLQASLMCCLAVLFTACDDILASEDNPTSAYLGMSDKPVTIKVGDTYKRQAVSVSSAIVEYTSSNTAVATVDGEGLVTAIAEGEAVITATATGFSSATGKKIFQPASASYQVTVLPAAPAPDPMLSTPLTMEAITAGTIKVINPQEGMQYTLNDGPKTAVTTTAIDVAIGDKVAFYGNGTSITAYSDGTANTNIAGGTAEVKVYGNIMSLIDETGFADNKTLTAANAFRRLFYGCTMLTDASGLLLPAETLTEFCYYEMFRSCSAMTVAPKKLPASVLPSNCYAHMFRQSGLVSVPADMIISATTMGSNCCVSMFRECASLTSAPVIAATIVGEASCNAMFYHCSQLTSADFTLPATDLASQCYYNMFNGCVALTIAPKLPATTLASQCYGNMFKGCTSLTAIYVKAGYDASCCADMFSNIGNTASITLYTDGVWSGYTAISNWVNAAYPTE